MVHADCSKNDKRTRINQKSMLLFVLLLIIFLFGCNSNANMFIDSQNKIIEYMGRTDQTDSTKEIYWSGSSIKIEFEGTTIKALLKDEKGENYFNIILDGDSLQILHPDTTKRFYTLAEGLSSGRHSITIFKRTEWTAGKTSFYGFEIEGNPKVYSIPLKKKVIEFYGDSITAGYAVEDYSGNDSPDSIYTNNYNSYAAITARYFNAYYSCIVRSGIGITISWFPQTMPELYNRLNPADSTSIWDFQKFTPDIVVINLLANDARLTRMVNHKEFKARFGTTPPEPKFIIQQYANFVKLIRGKYPVAIIICMFGNTSVAKAGSPWPGYIKTAVNSLDDKNILTLVVPWKKTYGHPRVEEQQVLADSLIHFIEKNNLW